MALSTLLCCHPGEQELVNDVEELQDFMASEDAFRSLPALQAAIAKDVEQRIQTCHLREPALIDPAPKCAAQHPGIHVALWL